MKTVLIVDDDKALQGLYKESLEQEGYRVFQAFSGKEGLSMAANEQPDLILLDIMMPGGMNGFDVLARLKQDKHLSKLKVLVLTNLPNEKDTAKAMGVKDYILKSDITAAELPRYIKKHVSWFHF